MTLAEMVRSLQVRFRGKGLEKIAELAGYWRLGSADEAHRRNLLVKHLKDKARMGQLDKLYAFEVEALLKEFPLCSNRTMESLTFSRRSTRSCPKSSYSS